MKKTGLLVFLCVSLIAHLTAAAIFVNQEEVAKEAKGVGTAALEIGNLFDSSAAEAVKPNLLDKAEPTAQEMERTLPVRAIRTKIFSQETVKPKILQASKAPKVLQQLKVDTEFQKPEIFRPKPVEPKKLEAKPVKPKELKQPPKKIVPSKKPMKPKKVVKKKPQKTLKQRKKTSKRKAKPRKKIARARTNSIASSKGGTKVNAQGRKKATGGSGGRSHRTDGAYNHSNYKGLVQAKILRKRRYPSASKRRRERGTTTISFTVAPSGSMSGLRLVRSSGSSRLDRAALGMARRAAPFPRMKPGGRTRGFSIKISFSPGH